MRGDKLEIQVKQLERQVGRVRQEVEMWQMRNEELEQRGAEWAQKCWALK